MTMPPPPLPGPGRRHQSGVMLVVVMLLLVVATLMALASFRLSTLETKMAGNSRDQQIAFQAAEAALRDVEQMIQADTDGPFRPLRESDFTATCTDGLCRSTTATPLWSTLTEDDWSGAKTMAYGAGSGAGPIAIVAEQPRVVVEYQGTVQPIEPGKPCVGLFLLTARAAGADASTRTVLQSVYRLRAGECYAAV